MSKLLTFYLYSHVHSYSSYFIYIVRIIEMLNDAFFVSSETDIKVSVKELWKRMTIVKDK